jgi:hypothetical protein
VKQREVEGPLLRTVKTSGMGTRQGTAESGEGSGKELRTPRAPIRKAAQARGNVQALAPGPGHGRKHVPDGGCQICSLTVEGSGLTSQAKPADHRLPVSRERSQLATYPLKHRPAWVIE